MRIEPFCDSLFRAAAETRNEECPDHTTHGGELPPTLAVGDFTRHCIAEHLVAR
jgi:hypothetical protein